MDALTSLTGLIEQLGQQTGLGPLAFDSAGVCALQIGPSVVHLSAEAGAELPLFYVPIGPLPEARYRRMLEANFSQAPGSLALDPRSGQAMLVARPRLAGMTMTEFEDTLHALANSAEEWSATPDEPAPESQDVPVGADAFASSMIKG